MAQNNIFNLYSCYIISGQMMSVYIPEVDRSLDILELIEYPHLLE